MCLLGHLRGLPDRLGGAEPRWRPFPMTLEAVTFGRRLAPCLHMPLFSPVEETVGRFPGGDSAVTTLSGS